jgi:hypothetical protein
MILLGILIGLVLGVGSALSTRSLNVGQIGIGIALAGVGAAIGFIVSLFAYFLHFSQDIGTLFLSVILTALVSGVSFVVVKLR